MKMLSCYIEQRITKKVRTGMQDGEDIVWWVALLLQLWNLPFDFWLETKKADGSDGTNTILAQMTALYSSMRTIAVSLAKQKGLLQPHSTLATLLELVEATQESCSR